MLMQFARDSLLPLECTPESRHHHHDSRQGNLTQSADFLDGKGLLQLSGCKQAPRYLRKMMCRKRSQGCIELLRPLSDRRLQVRLVVSVAAVAGNRVQGN